MAPVRGRRGRRGGRDRGASLVEAAFIFPVLFMIVFGMITFGNALGQKNAVENAAREASRYGARLPSDDVSQKFWVQDIIDVAVSASTGELEAGAADRYICVALSGSSTDDLKGTVVGSGSTTFDGVDTDCDRPDGTTVTCPTADPCVQVVLSRSTVVEGVVFSRTIDIEASSVSLWEREP